MDTVRQADESLGRAFDAALEAGDAEDVEVILRPTPRSGKSLGSGLLASVRELVSSPEVNPDEVRNFEVKGLDPQTGDVEALDLLESQILTSARIVQLDARTRGLDSSSAYAEIEKAHDDLLPDKEEAVSVVIV